MTVSDNETASSLSSSSSSSSAIDRSHHAMADKVKKEREIEQDLLHLLAELSVDGATGGGDRADRAGSSSSASSFASRSSSAPSTSRADPREEYDAAADRGTLADVYTPISL